MNAMLRDLGLYLWRLLPANPILVRVVLSSGRQHRHFWIRLFYLLILFGITLLGTVMTGTSAAASLGELAKASTRIFELISYTQVGMMCLIAPIFAAGAITQERDSETYNILLTTPLTNSQIVVGSLFSRLFFIFVLLLAALPIFSMTLLFGGVTLAQVLLTGAISACTALLFGSVAISIAVIGVGSRRTIFTFYLLIALYLALIWALAPFLPAPGAPVPQDGSAPMSWLAPFHPFLALNIILGRTPPPQFSDLSALSQPWPYLLAYPYESYMALTGLASLVVIGACIGFVRHGAMLSEQTLLERLLQRLMFWKMTNGRLTRRPRTVWDNPVAWREARTRSHLGGTGLMRGLLLVGGIAAAAALLVHLYKTAPSAANAGQMREYLFLLVSGEFGLILLMSANLAAGSMTREYEGKALQILIATPLTPAYIIGGKIRGLVLFALPMLVIPALTGILFGAIGLVQPAYETAPWEGGLLAGVVMAAYAAMACDLGLYISLNNTNTVVAMMKTLALLIIINGVLYGFASSLLGSNTYAAAIGSLFSPFLAIRAMLDPQLLLKNSTNGGGVSLADVRITLAIGTAVVLVAAGFLTHQTYRSMTRAFDAIIRTKISEAG